MRYRLPHTIRAIERKSRVVRAWKDENGQKAVQEEDLGWFITLEPGLLCCPVGTERPDLKVGQRMDVILEPRDDQA